MSNNTRCQPLWLYSFGANVICCKVTIDKCIAFPVSPIIPYTFKSKSTIK